MFKKFFNKKTEKALEVKQDWASYFCNVDSKPASVRLNLALHEIAPIESYSHRVWFSIKLLNPDENGLTTREEFPIICNIEDEVSGALEKTGAIAVGALKTDGTFDLYFYTKSVGNYISSIQSIMSNYPDYQFATETKIDKEWYDYFNFLYPEEYEYQTIQNQRILINLEKEGDNPEIERLIDHWLIFEKEDAREKYISKIERLGYKVLSKNNLSEGKYNYQLNIAKVSDATRNTINDNVWQLITLAKEDHGSYDGWGCPISK